MTFFNRALQDILSGFHSVVSELESFATRVEVAANKKLQKVEQLKSEADSHLEEAAQAKGIAANIKALLKV